MPEWDAAVNEAMFLRCEICGKWGRERTVAWETCRATLCQEHNEALDKEIMSRPHLGDAICEAQDELVVTKTQLESTGIDRHANYMRKAAAKYREALKAAREFAFSWIAEKKAEHEAAK